VANHDSCAAHSYVVIEGLLIQILTKFWFCMTWEIKIGRHALSLGTYSLIYQLLTYFVVESGSRA
jgi:hypothetical protein